MAGEHAPSVGHEPRHTDRHPQPADERPMMPRVSTMAGGPARSNEDFLGVIGSCAILLEASGAPGDLPTGCVHGVPWFVRQFGRAPGPGGPPPRGRLADMNICGPIRPG